MKIGKTRRTLAVLVAGLMLLAACAADDADVSEAPEDARGGSLTVGVWNEPPFWSMTVYGVVFYPQFRNLYDAILDYDDDMNPFPQLAESWEISDDSRMVTIRLRDDVLFHSGRQMTAEDVAANLEYYADPDTGRQLLSGMQIVDSWEVVDDFTLVVQLTDTTAPGRITDLLQTWTIGDPEFFDEFDARPAGTGPFKFEEFITGERIVLVRNDDYWGEPAILDEVVYRIFDDKDAMISAFETGVVDVAFDITADDGNRLAQTGTVLEGFPGAVVDGWRINPMTEPFDDRNIRHAINFATDREAIFAASYHGYGQASAMPFAPASVGFDAELNEEFGRFDLDHVRQLLEESSYGPEDWRASVMVNAPSQEATNAAQILQEALSEVGFELEIEVVDQAEFTERLVGGGFGLVYSSIGFSQKYPTTIGLNSIYRDRNNPVGVDTLFPEYAPAMAAATRATTEDDQAAAIRELNEIMAERMFASSVGLRPFLIAVGDHVEGVWRNSDNMLLLAEARIVE